MAAARALALALLALTACRDEERVPFRGEAPPARRIVLEGVGIGCLRIGMPLAALGGACRTLADRTVAGPEGMPERRVEVELGADTLVATVVRDSVWRAEVTTPRFRTEDGVGVGSSAVQLLARPESRLIGGEGRLFVTLPDRCGLSFEIGDVPREVLALPPEAAADRIPASSRIARVLVFGCGRRA